MMKRVVNMMEQDGFMMEPDAIMIKQVVNMMQQVAIMMEQDWFMMEPDAIMMKQVVNMMQQDTIMMEPDAFMTKQDAIMMEQDEIMTDWGGVVIGVVIHVLLFRTCLFFKGLHECEAHLA